MRLAALLVAVILVTTACGEAPPSEGDLGSSGSPPSPAPVPAPSTPAEPVPADTTMPADPCLRGGTPRADVRRIMGEPDSVVWGSWFYGRSEVQFGYGVVLTLRDQGELILCDPS